MGYVADAIKNELASLNSTYRLLLPKQCESLWLILDAQLGFAWGYHTVRKEIDEYRCRCDRPDLLLCDTLPETPHILIFQDEGLLVALELQQVREIACLIGEMFDFSFAVVAIDAAYSIAYDDHGTIQGLETAADWLRKSSKSRSSEDDSNQAEP